MIRSFLTVSTGTLASRLLGFARDSMIAALLGTGAVADAFLAAFQLVNVVRRLLSEGALNAALIPAWLRVRDRDGAAAAETAKAAVALGRACVVLTRTDSCVCVQVPSAKPEWGQTGLGGFLKQKAAESGGRGGGGKTNFRASFPDHASAEAFADFAFSSI